MLDTNVLKFVSGVNKGGVQRFNGHLYWFSWQVRDNLFFTPVLYLYYDKRFCTLVLQDNDGSVRNAKWDWFNARNYCR